MMRKTNFSLVIVVFLELLVFGQFVLGDSKMYWTDKGTGKVQRANLDGSNIEDLVTTWVIDPYGIALDPVGGKMYWTDYGAHKIQRANLDGSSIEILVTTGISFTLGIALDPVGSKMYWADYYIGNRIQRANMDGSNVENIVTTGLRDPSGIALDPVGGKIYWTDYGAHKIQRANLDGSNVEDLVTTGIWSPSGIALDTVGGKMYWTDYARDKIQRANLDGSSIEDLVTTGLSYPHGISLDLLGGKMYWTDYSAHKIQRANLDGSNVENLVTTGLSKPTGIAIPQLVSLDDLEVRPQEILNTSGVICGPFDPNSITYTLTNIGPNLLDWAVNATEPWLNVVPGSGTLTGGAAATVEISINANANKLPAGIYYDTVEFTNQISAFTQTREVILIATLEQAKLTPSDGYANDRFGWSVAISGDYAIVGAYHDDDNGTDSGSAYIFQRDGNNWTELNKLLPSDGYYGDEFGFSVAINGDYAIVGARSDDDNGGGSGSAYIFHRSGSDWTEQAKLTPADGYSYDYFGWSVAISGEYAIVGAYADDDNGSGSGSAYIFQRSGSDWIELAKLLPSDGYRSDCFGVSVAISGDYAIVGAYADDDNGSGSGSAYIFQRSGSDWTEQKKLTPADGYIGDEFGCSVAISGDYAIVGAREDDNKGIDSGSAYIFQRSGSDWTEQAKLTPADGYTDDLFGTSVAISGDHAIVGAYHDDDNGDNSGSAYIFQRTGSDWTEQPKLLSYDGYSFDYFGWSVAISDDYAIVGAYRNDNVTSSSSAYIFAKEPPIEVAMKFTPQALNLSSGGQLVKAHFVLPEGFTVEDVDANTPAVIEPYGIESYNLSVLLNDEGLVRVEATFNRSDLCSAITVYDQNIELKVTGLLTTGQQFYGTDTIRIINNKFEQLAVLSSYWLQTDCDKPDWCAGADLNHDSVVNFLDFALLDRCCIEVPDE